MVLASVAFAAPATAASAAAQFHATDEISARPTPTAAATSLVGPHRGQTFDVECQVIGEPVGPRANTLYFRTTWNVSGTDRTIYVPDTWTDSPHTAGQPPLAGIPMCGQAVLAAAPVTQGTTVGGHAVGAAQNARHRWGACEVQDFKGGEFDWTIVSRTAGTHLVHGGMMWGWFDQGGGTGALGCPTSDEYGYLGFVRQDFQHGSLYWTPGMNHAAVLDPAHDRLLHAVDWARARMGWTGNDNLCQQFVHDALASAGIEIGGADSAASWAAAHQGQLTTTGIPPVGALVYWWGDWYNSDGHVAISLGNGTAISTLERITSGVHVLNIADRNSEKPYAGWIVMAG